MTQSPEVKEAMRLLDTKDKEKRKRNKARAKAKAIVANKVAAAGEWNARKPGEKAGNFIPEGCDGAPIDVDYWEEKEFARIMGLPIPDPPEVSDVEALEAEIASAKATIKRLGVEAKDAARVEVERKKLQIAAAKPNVYPSEDTPEETPEETSEKALA